MSKSDVYSWRVDPALKGQLEAAARAENTSVSAVIERACRSWLEHSDDASAGKNRQARRRRAVEEIVASARARDLGGPPTASATNANVRKAFAQKLARDRSRRPRAAR
jgi:predicted transcriptional regulator